LTERALVLAHYHSRGAIRSDTLRLLSAALACCTRVILVSTRLETAERARLPSGVEVHIRDNIGYDFYSYRHGMQQLLPGEAPALDEICLMNSSFLCLDAGRFLDRLFRSGASRADCFGLVRSREIADHIQSYVVVLRRPALLDPTVRSWWMNMTPISERSRVILQYEIGLSQLLLGRGYRLEAAYDHLALVSPDILRLCRGQAVNVAELNARLNPSHFHWLNLLREFSTLKIEVYRSNPFGLDLQPLMELARADAGVQQLLEEGLRN
jgi:rhamnosyltransferase